MRYGDSTNFDITIHSAPPGNSAPLYPLSVIYRTRSAEGVFAQDANETFWQRVLPTLEDPARAPGRALLRESGSHLFRALMQGAVRDLWIRARADLEEQVFHRLRLRLAMQPPAVAQLPWELLYDAERNEALAASNHTPLVRVERRFQHVGAQRVQPVETPIRILVAIPDDPSGQIDPHREMQEITTILDRLGDASARVATLTGRFDIVELRRQIDRVRPAVLHFIGHGVPDGLLLWRRDEPLFAPPEAFRTILQNRPQLKLILLNTCLAGQLAETRAFSSMAPQLLQAGATAVIAMQFAISDRFATQFAAYLYEELLTGPHAGALDVAMSRARGNLYALDPDCAEYGAPVLWLDAEDGVIFELPPSSAGRAAFPAPAPASARKPTTIDESVPALARLRNEAATIEAWLQTLKQPDEPNAGAEVRTWLVHRNREIRHLRDLFAQLHNLARQLDAVPAPPAQVRQYEAKLAEIRRKEETVRRLDARIQAHGNAR
jgi:hypothetical protein